MASQASFYTASVVVQDDDFAVGQANHDEIVGKVEAHWAFTKVNNLKLVCAAYNVFFLILFIAYNMTGCLSELIVLISAKDLVWSSSVRR